MLEFAAIPLSHCRFDVCVGLPLCPAAPRKGEEATRGSLHHQPAWLLQFVCKGQGNFQCFSRINIFGFWKKFKCMCVLVRLCLYLKRIPCRIAGPFAVLDICKISTSKSNRNIFLCVFRSWRRLRGGERSLLHWSTRLCAVSWRLRFLPQDAPSL